MLNFVHTFGATKNEFSGKGGSLAPSVPYAGTTEGPAQRHPVLVIEYNHWDKSTSNH
jgi:hypothetical protein